MESPASSPAQGLASDEERRVRTYHQEIYPFIGQRLADLLLAGVHVPAQARVLALGCSLGGGLTDLILRSTASHCTALELSPALSERARATVGDSKLAARMAFQAHHPDHKLPFEAATFDLALASLAWSELSQPELAIAELARVVRPGGQIRLATLTQGTWQEFLDVYRDVLVRLHREDALASLRGYTGAFPEPAGVCALIEEAGFSDVRMERERWELVFSSAREFFYAPVIEQGPLPVWRRIAGKGALVQDTFLAVKEALDTYFAGRPFGVGIVAAMVSAERVM
jgi:SAM-dependent methyltransferase